VNRIVDIVYRDYAVRGNVKRFLLMAALLTAATVLGFVFFAADFPEPDIALVYILAVLIIAWLTHSYVFSFFATLLATFAYNFFFTDPYFNFRVYDSSLFTTFITMSIAAFIACTLTLQARRSTLVTKQKEGEVEKERYRANLLRGISHDIRTPLSAILGATEMLEGMTEPDDPRRKLILEMHSEVKWLRSLVENILHLTRLQDGALPLQKQPEAVEEVVGSAVRHISQRHSVTVRMPDELLLVPMDAKLIQQVLINLLDNAARYTAPEDEICITVDRKDAFVRITVSDEGVGIPDNDLPRLFQTFFSTHDKHTGSEHGIGLGLSLCETIVKAHGGEISARNRTDRRGAEFVFTLPMEDGKDG
jgi:two-component system sensor histidine kinase KdpD